MQHLTNLPRHQRLTSSCTSMHRQPAQEQGEKERKEEREKDDRDTDQTVQYHTHPSPQSVLHYTTLTPPPSPPPPTHTILTPTLGRVTTTCRISISELLCLINSSHNLGNIARLHSSFSTKVDVVTSRTGHGYLLAHASPPLPPILSSIRKHKSNTS